MLTTKRQTEKAGKRTKQTITSTSKELELFGEGGRNIQLVLVGLVAKGGNFISGGLFFF